jgi:hypothetical protein
MFVPPSMISDEPKPAAFGARPKWGATLNEGEIEPDRQLVLALARQ